MRMTKKNREKISDDLSAKVMFASDRTCCICRTEKLKVQIHHIDSEPSNNSFENLAVICLHCHSDAHTSGAFVRGLTPELVTLYNESWREVVKLRLLPKPKQPNNIELIQEALLQTSLDCHYWKVQFMSLLGGSLPKSSPGQFDDVWDAMAELWVPKYDLQIYEKYKILFTSAINTVCQRFNSLGAQYADALSPSVRILLLRGQRQLQAEQFGYLLLPNLSNSGSVETSNLNGFFYQRFVGVIRVLREIARESDRIRESLVSDDSN